MPLEPRSAVAEWTDGKLTVWTGTQRPFGVRTELAEAFRIPETQVRVIVPDTGSGARRQALRRMRDRSGATGEGGGKPVKLVWTRAEEFRFGFRPAGVIDVKTAVDGDGRITAWEFDNWNSGPSAIQTPCDIPNKRSVLSVGTPLRQGSYAAWRRRRTLRA